MVKQLTSFLILLLIFPSLKGSTNQVQEKPIVEIVNSQISPEAQSDFKVFPKGKIKALIFISTWCPSCRTLDPVLEKLGTDLRDIQFIEYDVDINKDLLEKYGIESFPKILVLDKNNNFIESFRINQDEEFKKLSGSKHVPINNDVYKGLKEYFIKKMILSN